MKEALLREAVRQLATYRRELERRRSIWNEYKARLEEDHAELRAAIEEYQASVADLELTIRREALTVDPDALPAGVKIRNRQVLEYDEAAVIEWAQEQMPIFVRVERKLDRKPFEALVKAQPTVCPKATVTIQPEATIAKDLDAVLDTEEPTDDAD
jgi:uncharacterized protein YhaN